MFRCWILLSVAFRPWAATQPWGVNSFIIKPTFTFRNSCMSNLRALGEYSLELDKPLGLILEENDSGNGVRIKEVASEGGAANTCIAPGDVLLRVSETNVANRDFDSIMDLLIESASPVSLTLGDGLGQLDMPKNVLRMISTTKDAYLVDAVVRQAVRVIRKSGRLGDLLKVEVVIGAGVTGGVCKVRFFAIFSTDGVTTYSCNVSATGCQLEDERIEITALSCAKDEGLGQTIDLITEKTA